VTPKNDCVVLKWTMGAWMHGHGPAALLRPLRECTVSTRVNRAGVGDDDPALIEQVE
jgi:hypothetical protein